MKFDFKLESISTDALRLDYFKVPWDSDIFGKQVAQITKIEVSNCGNARKDFIQFQQWCRQQNIEICSCRILHGSVQESMFLEEQGFRFIELNYRPVLFNLHSHKFYNREIKISYADDGDRSILIEAAGKIFHNERFHKDPRIDCVLANKRYQIWMENGFTLSNQKILKCEFNSHIIGFFLIEYPEPSHCFWSLVGILPQFQGQGFGKKVWQAMLSWNQKEGVRQVSTSISSHNIQVFNLYVTLGFRFPEPFSTFHWVSK